MREERRAWAESGQNSTDKAIYRFAGNGYESELEEDGQTVKVTSNEGQQGAWGVVRFSKNNEKVVKTPLTNQKDREVSWAFAQQEQRYYSAVYPEQTTLFRKDDSSFEYRLVMPNWGADAFWFFSEKGSSLSGEKWSTLLLATAKELVRIHGLGWVHRDFKPENILVKEKKAGQYQIKIADGAYACKQGENFYPYGNQLIYRKGKYIPPELRDKSNQLPANPDQDVYSFADLVICTVRLEVNRDFFSPKIEKLLGLSKDSDPSLRPNMAEWVAEFEKRVEHFSGIESQAAEQPAPQQAAVDRFKNELIEFATEYQAWNQRYASGVSLSRFFHLSHGVSGRRDVEQYLSALNTVRNLEDINSETKAFLTGGKSPRSGYRYTKTTGAKAHSRNAFFKSVLDQVGVFEKPSLKSVLHSNASHVALAVAVAAVLTVLIVASQGVAIPFVSPLLFVVSKPLGIAGATAVLGSSAAVALIGAREAVAGLASPRFEM